MRVLGICAFVGVLAIAAGLVTPSGIARAQTATPAAAATTHRSAPDDSHSGKINAPLTQVTTANTTTTASAPTGHRTTCTSDTPDQELGTTATILPWWLGGGGTGLLASSGTYI